MIRHLFLPLYIGLLLGLTNCSERTTATTDTGLMTGSSTPSSATRAFGGLALYTLRDSMAGDPRGVLRQVADMGYEYIEAAGYRDGKFYGMAPKEFKAYLDEVGLKPMSSHHGDITVETAAAVAADLKEAGFEYLVIPVPPMGAFEVDRATRTMKMTQPMETVMGNMNAIAHHCAEAGIKTLYHNHDFEFKPNSDGLTVIDYFLENSDPELLNFQMDLFWVTKAGADPLAYFEKYPGRWTAWHVKDMDPEGRFAPVGTGSIDFGRILAEKEKAGMEFYLVEQDGNFQQPPLEAVNISHGGLGKIGFD